MLYVSIDTETTGLKQESAIMLEAGLVVADTDKEFELTPTNHLRIVFCRQTLVGDVYALLMHTHLLQEINDVLQNQFKEPDNLSNLYVSCSVQLEKEDHTENVLYVNLADYMLEYLNQDDELVNEAYENIADIIEKFFADNNININEEKITVAGKNFAGFDVKFLREFDPFVNLIVNKTRHRTIDVGNFYVEADDEVMPNLKTCLERAGINKEVEHTSIGDAVDVVHLVQHHFKGLKAKKADT